MNTTWSRLTLRFVMLAIVVAALPMLLPPRAATGSPYLSALSDLSAAPVYAAGCPDKRCDRGVECVPGAGYKCVRFHGRGCTATACG